MTEEAMVGEHHGQATCLSLGDDLLITDGSSGPHHEGCSRFSGLYDPVGEGEERIADEDAPSARDPARRDAIRTASTLLVCPGPIPTVAVPWIITMALDFTCSQTRCPNRIASICASSGCRDVTTSSVAGSSRGGASV